MRIYSQNDLKARFKEFGFQWPSFHIIGVRSKADVPNVFDDNFYLIDKDQMHIYTGTTNPGTDWLTTFLNPKGSAVVVADKQYLDSWTLGLHHGEYPAWVQAKPISVYRDRNKDLKSDEVGIPDIGMFGINWHHANSSTRSKFISKWSAGCQVFDDPKEHFEFMELSRKSGQKFFTGTILKEW